MSLKGKLTALVSILKWEKKVPIVQKVAEGKLLNDKTALIIGGSGGIGIAIAKKYKENGCNVILAGTNLEKLKKTASEIGVKAFLTINMNDVSSFEQKIKEAVSFFGKIDVLVYASGIHTKRNDLDFLNVSEAEYDSVMNVNLKGAYFICQTASKYMIGDKIKGHILVISSQSALEPSWSPYRLSKKGLSGLVAGMAQKLIPHGIVVNAIGPGPTATGMQDECIGGSVYTSDNPIGRYTMPDEIAEYALLMVSHLGDTIVGDTVYMSGGRGIIDMH